MGFLLLGRVHPRLRGVRILRGDFHGWLVGQPLPFGPDLPDVNPASWGALGAILLPLIQFGVLMAKSSSWSR